MEFLYFDIHDFVNAIRSKIVMKLVMNVLCTKFKLSNVLEKLEINFISNVVAIIYIISKRRFQSLIVSIYMLYRVVLSESQL